MPRPRIVCLCGSTRFQEAFRRANRDFTLQGVIVLSVGVFGHTSAADDLTLTEADKQRLDALHLQKVAMADEVHFLNCGGYIGESTQNELACALALGKKVSFVDEDAGNAYLEANAHAIGQLVAAHLRTLPGPDCSL